MILSILIAAYNEEPIIQETIERVAKKLSAQDRYTWEIVVVDDGSKDRTGAILDSLAKELGYPITVFHHKRNFGQGRALQSGFKICRGEIIVTLDADLSYDEDHIIQLVKEIEEKGADICLAAAYLPGGAIHNVPWLRIKLSQWGNRFLCFMHGQRLHVISCVTRAYRRWVVQKIPLMSDGMEMNLEIINKARILGCNIIEIPARLAWHDSKRGEGLDRKSKISILKTVKRYLLVGTLFRPAQLVFWPGILAFILGIIGGMRVVLGAVKQLASPHFELVRNNIIAFLIQTFKDNIANLTVALVLVFMGTLMVILAILSRYMQMIYEENLQLHVALVDQVNQLGKHSDVHAGET